MRALRFVFCLVIILFSHPHPAHAARFTGSYLLEVCDIGTDKRERVKGGHAVCQSYIAGVIDMMNFMESFEEDQLCIPPETTLNELHMIVLQYLRDNVQHDDFIASPAVATSLLEYYRCN